MRKLTIFTGVLGLLLAAACFTSLSPARAADDMQGMDMSSKADAKRPRCENCGMFTDVSSTRVTAQVTLDGKTGDHIFVCPGCLREKLEDWGDKAKLKGFKVLDYTTFKTKHEQMIDGLDAYYLLGTKELPGSMDEPYVAAFASKEAATKAQPALGGDIVHGWDALREKLEAAEQKDADASVTKVASKEDAAQPAMVYVCPCGCANCKDVQSDKPGVCPKCGMQLVPKKEG